MALADIWKQTPEQLHGKTVQQVLAFAGNGKLRDGNNTSVEFREYLSHIPSDMLQAHAVQCLEATFPDGGLALQDIVNQIGRRLGFKATSGRYHGSATAVGFDGLWHARNGSAILVEVKTSSTYRITLDTVANYRQRLIGDGTIGSAESSILYVVGRDDTGELEAQIRGSRHAWDIRLISIEALLRLLRIKEQLDEERTIDRIRDILMPREFTRVDGIIDLVFSTASEAQQVTSLDDGDELAANSGKQNDRREFRDACVARLQEHFDESLVRITSTIFSTPDDATGVLCSISRTHERAHGKYWFKFRPSQQQALESYKKAFIALACGSEAQMLLIPLHDFVSWLPRFNRTELDGTHYWHIHVSLSDGRWLIESKRGQAPIDVTAFVMTARKRKGTGAKGMPHRTA